MFFDKSEMTKSVLHSILKVEQQMQEKESAVSPLLYTFLILFPEWDMIQFFFALHMLPYKSDDNYSNYNNGNLLKFIYNI